MMSSSIGNTREIIATTSNCYVRAIASGVKFADNTTKSLALLGYFSKKKGLGLITGINQRP